jgi:hypothetical protein
MQFQARISIADTERPEAMINTVFQATKLDAYLMHLRQNLLHSGYCLWFNMLTSPILLQRQRPSSDAGIQTQKCGAT